jgi:starch phosphorylase
VAFEGDVPLANTGSFGYAVRVLPTNPLLASPMELGLMAIPSSRPDGDAPPSW